MGVLNEKRCKLFFMPRNSAFEMLKGVKLVKYYKDKN